VKVAVCAWSQRHLQGVHGHLLHFATVVRCKGYPHSSARMNDQSRTMVRVAAAATAATAAVVAIALVRRRAGCHENGTPASNEDRERLIAILRELSTRFFHVCQDVASISKTVRARIQASNVAITDDKLREQLAKQCKVFDKLEEIQVEVAKQFDCSPADIKAMQQRATRDKEVRALTDGFKTMLSDALSGHLPVLPDTKIPPGLTEDRVLGIQAAVNALQTKKVLEAIGGTQCTLKRLGEVLGTTQKDAWQEVLSDNADIVQGPPEVFHSALAVYMRNEDFAAERKKLDDAHQQKIMKLFQATEKAPAKQAPKA